MSVDSALRRFRGKQAEQFTQTARIDRPIGLPVYDPETRTTSQPVRTIGTKACKTTNQDINGVDVQVGETTVRTVVNLVKFEPGTDLENRDLITIVSSKYNPSDVARQYRVLDVDRREWQIARRATIEEVVVPLSNVED